MEWFGAYRHLHSEWLPPLTGIINSLLASQKYVGSSSMWKESKIKLGETRLFHYSAAQSIASNCPYKGWLGYLAALFSFIKRKAEKK